MPKVSDKFEATLRSHAQEFDVELNTAMITGLRRYYELLMKWNTRLHLVAPCSPEEFATRHVLESLLLLRYIKKSAAVIDIGSGGGLPLMPVLIARKDIKATLIESSRKKAIFLREALRTASCRATVIVERFEDIAPLQADYLTCRALERLSQKLPGLLDWAPAGSTLLIFAGEALREELQKLGRQFSSFRIPGSVRRYLIVVDRS